MFGCRHLYLSHNNSAQVVTKFGQNLVHFWSPSGDRIQRGNWRYYVTIAPRIGRCNFLLGNTDHFRFQHSFVHSTSRLLLYFFNIFIHQITHYRLCNAAINTSTHLPQVLMYNQTIATPQRSAQLNRIRNGDFCGRMLCPFKLKYIVFLAIFSRMRKWFNTKRETELSLKPRVQYSSLI